MYLEGSGHVDGLIGTVVKLVPQPRANRLQLLHALVRESSGGLAVVESLFRNVERPKKRSERKLSNDRRLLQYPRVGLCCQNQNPRWPQKQKYPRMLYTPYLVIIATMVCIAMFPPVTVGTPVL